MLREYTPAPGDKDHRAEMLWDYVEQLAHYPAVASLEQAAAVNEQKRHAVRGFCDVLLELNTRTKQEDWLEMAGRRLAEKEGHSRWKIITDALRNEVRELIRERKGHTHYGEAGGDPGVEV